MLNHLPTPSMWPEDLLDESVEDFSDPDLRWWVMYTKSRQEKALARDLFGHQINFYLPLVRHTKIYGRRKIHTDEPVFAGYLFMYGTEDQRVDSLKTNRISRILDVLDPQALRSDLSQLRQLIASNAPLTVESRIRPGNRVRIKRGQLAGLEGTVLYRRGETRILIQVDFLQQGASIAIDDYLLEPIG